MNRTQATLILVMIVISWVPVTVFLIFFWQRFTQRQLAIVALINMAIFVPFIIFIYRRWISKLK